MMTHKPNLTREHLCKCHLFFSMDSPSTIGPGISTLSKIDIMFRIGSISRERLRCLQISGHRAAVCVWQSTLPFDHSGLAHPRRHISYSTTAHVERSPVTGRRPYATHFLLLLSHTFVVLWWKKGPGTTHFVKVGDKRSVWTCDNDNSTSPRHTVPVLLPDPPVSNSEISGRGTRCRSRNV